MKQKVYQIEYGDKKVKCIITYKRIKSIIFRLDRDGSSLRVSCPPFVKDDCINSKISEVLPRLYSRSVHESPIEGDDLYIFGAKRHIDGFSSLSNDKQKALLRSFLLPYCKEKCGEYSKMMGIETLYEVKVRDMNSRYGVNNRSKRKLTFALSLVHYAPSIIDSVIVHELAHHYVFDHSKAFYEVVYHYYPTYKIDHGKLRKHIYK